MIVRAAIFVLILLASCSTQKKCERFIKKHPYCFKSTNDTISTSDTIYYNEGLDTLVMWQNDTITLTDGLDTIYLTRGDKVRGNILKNPDVIGVDWINKTKVIRDTIRIKNTISKVYPCKKGSRLIYFLSFLLGAIVGIAIIRGLKKSD